MLLSRISLKAFQTLSAKAHRSEHDWTIIKRLLFDADMVYAHAVDGENVEILCYGSLFPVFTTMEAAREGLANLPAKAQLDIAPFRKLGLWADDIGKTLVVDAKPAGGQAISYSKGRIDCVSIISPPLDRHPPAKDSLKGSPTYASIEGS